MSTLWDQVNFGDVAVRFLCQMLRVISLTKVYDSLGGKPVRIPANVNLTVVQAHEEIKGRVSNRSPTAKSDIV
jgi:hypothetical protein